MKKKTADIKNKIEKKSVAGQDYIVVVGRRKEAIARVRLFTKIKDDMMLFDKQIKKGDIIVNEKYIAAYFQGDIAKARYEEPMRITNNLNKFAIIIKVVGGGPQGQLDAVIHGISRALSKLDKEKSGKILRKRGLLTRDARVRQRRKVGMGGKSRRKKQSPKR